MRIEVKVTLFSTLILIVLGIAIVLSDRHARPPTLDQLLARTAILYVEHENAVEGKANSMQGTGILLDSGQILTSGHVFRQGVTGEGYFFSPEPKFTFMRTPVELFTDGKDVSTVQVWGVPTPETMLKVRCTAPVFGEDVFSITYPTDNWGSLLLRGAVAHPGPVTEDGRYAVTGFEVHPGMSGAPIFDGEGRLLGTLLNLSPFMVGGVATFLPAVDIGAVCPKEET